MNAPVESSEALADCAAACSQALQAALACANACIRSGDRSLESCTLLALDCADICQATLGALTRASDHHGDFCALSAHLCTVCADECERHPHAHCKRCAQACRACAEACAVHAGERHSLRPAH
ncbi:four-helix bundle copper-binding protein [Roseateles amylovorans]|uniref:Four-helix bundle copper-binding protein n=1 Tax=Roseateles amylovorans TaxID=2978473 RepID=A0ABY6AWP3_9BURK|nr:four-helix bundle copper-binding protein [Roseateles amylovorans]UXH76251.1 four-helix bundle copper-binding protein [Roseateles amylovorans]